jgi:hypothetical protein
MADKLGRQALRRQRAENRKKRAEVFAKMLANAEVKMWPDGKGIDVFMKLPEPIKYFEITIPVDK